MLIRTGLAAAFLIGFAAPALAATCNEPVAPEISVVGATASVQQMKDAISDFKTYQSAADDFESCINADIKQKKDEAAQSKDQKPVDPAIISALSARSDAVQAEKEKLAGQLNVQIVEYKKAHPSKPKS